MLERYGKDIQMRKIRSFDDERKYNERAKKAARNFFDKEGNKEHSRCRVCGSDETKPYFEAYGGYLYYECMNCGSLFLDNLPRLDEMYRDDGISNTRAYIKDEIFEERVNQIQLPKVDFVLDLCKRNGIVSRTWVDVGAGGGTTACCC